MFRIATFLFFIFIGLFECTAQEKGVIKDAPHFGNDWSFLRNDYGRELSKISFDSLIVFSNKRVKISFQYDSMQVANHLSESDFVAKMREENNKVDSGFGDQWAEEWYSSRKTIYEPRFIRRLISLTSMASILFVDDSSYDYNFVVYTTKIDMGPEEFLVESVATIDAKIVIENRQGIPLGFVLCNYVPGRNLSGTFNSDFDKIGECYGKLAKEFYTLVLKKELGEQKNKH
jgi:hypothetical protein